MTIDPALLSPPTASVPAYETLLEVLARDAPEALAAAAASLDDDALATATPLPPAADAASLARQWLTRQGRGVPTAAPEGQQTYTFSFPAQLGFDVVAKSPGSARRRARRALDALTATDRPLVFVSGPLPGHPVLMDVELWLGSAGPGDDVLSLESVE